MGIFDRLRDQEDTEYSDFSALEVDQPLVEAFEDITPNRDALAVLPYEDNGGIEAMDEFLTSIHRVRTKSPLGRSGSQNISPAHSFEARYTEDEEGQRAIRLQYVPGSTDIATTFKEQLDESYPSTELEWEEPSFLDIEEGQYLAGCELGLRRYTLYPIKNIEMDDFRKDPSGAIIKQMVDSERSLAGAVDCAFQIMFRPAKEDWEDGVPEGLGVDRSMDKDDPNMRVKEPPGLELLADKLTDVKKVKEKKTFTTDTRERDPTDTERKLAKMLESQEGKKGWELVVRIFAVADEAHQAEGQAAQVANQFQNFYEQSSKQTFVPQPLTGKDLRRDFLDATKRNFRETGWKKTQIEISGLVNIPKAEYVNTADLRFSISKSSRGVPPGTPRFDYQEAGVAEATTLEQRNAMIETSGPGDPLWLGWGKNKGTEAGIFEDVLDTHMFVGGSTGEGKTTFLENLQRQFINREYGLLINDPKGKDTDEILSLVPEEREDDVVFVQIGTDRDRAVGFNLFDLDTDAEPGSAAFENALESMVDVVEGVLAEAGGEDGEYSWGVRMSQITRNMVRGMAKAMAKEGYQLTPLDMYLALLDEPGRLEYAKLVSDARLEWIRQYAVRELADMTEDDVRPVVGRLKNLVENPITREIISQPESTVSIRDIVKDGKIVVVQDKTTQSEAAKLVTTIIVPKIWQAIRTISHDSTQPEPPEFYMILDEFKDVVTENAYIGEILSEARAYPLSFIASTQDFSSQLPLSVQEALEGQADTFISFNPGRDADASSIATQHASNVSAEDLTDLDPYTFYLRTIDKNDRRTHSYKVDAFRPLVDDASLALSPDEVEAVKRRSLEKYGAERRTTEETLEDTYFAKSSPEGAGGGDIGGGEMGDGAAVGHGGPGDRDKRTLLAAADHVHIRYDRVGEFVPADVVKAEFKERRQAASSTKVSDLIEVCVDEGLLEQQRVSADDGDEVQLKITPAGRREAGLVESSGEGGQGGKDDHRWELRVMRHLFIRMGCQCKLPSQTGEELADALVQLPIDLTEYTDDPVEFREKETELREEYPDLYQISSGRHISIEAESTTLKQPAQTSENLRKALENNRTCLFAVKDASGSKDSVEYWANRAEGVLYNRVSGELDYDTVAVEKDQEATATYYTHKRRKFSIDDRTVLRPADSGRETYWVREDDGSVVIKTDEGYEAGRFDSPEAVDDPSVADVKAYYEYDQDSKEYIVYKPNGEKTSYEEKDRLKSFWTPIPDPFIPEVDFPRQPRAEDFAIAIVPNDDSDFDVPQLYVEGEMQPITDGFDVSIDDVQERLEDPDVAGDEPPEAADDAPGTVETATEAESERAEEATSDAAGRESGPTETGGERPAPESTVATEPRSAENGRRPTGRGALLAARWAQSDGDEGGAEATQASGAATVDGDSTSPAAETQPSGTAESGQDSGPGDDVHLGDEDDWDIL